MNKCRSVHMQFLNLDQVDNKHTTQRFSSLGGFPFITVPEHSQLGLYCCKSPPFVGASLSCRIVHKSDLSFFLLSQILIRNIPWGHRCCQRTVGALFNMWNKKTKLNWWLTIIRESFASQTQSLWIELGYFNKIVVDSLVLTGEFIGANLFLIGWIPEARGVPWLAVCHHGYRTISLF